MVNNRLYTIQILTDAGSWMLPYVDNIAKEWALAGHDVRVSNQTKHTISADFCFCLSFSEIIPSEIRKQFRHTLVVHGSDLPDGRGWAPFTWQILEGKTRIPVTLIEAVDAVDAGSIYCQVWVDLNGTELNSEWRALQARATNQLCSKWIEMYPRILDTARQQVGEGTIYNRRTPSDSELDPNKTLMEQFDLMRVVDNERYPAFFEIRGRRYRLTIDSMD